MWYFSAIDFHKKHFLGYVIRSFLISCFFDDFLHDWEDFAWFVVPTNFSKIHKVDVLVIRVIFIAIPFSPTVRCVTRGQGGGQFPARPITGRRRNLPTMFQVLSSIQYIYSQKTSFEHGGSKLASCPRRHLTSAQLLRPKCPAGRNNLAQCPCPRETRCKTSCAKRFNHFNVYLIL